jgi:SAM-dependent methyltransferase
MLIKNLLRIVKSYKFSLITIVFYEIIYLLKGFKGNKFHFSENNKMSDDIPCPYYFLYKIKKILSKFNFKTFLDLGCGSGRVIDFFSKNLVQVDFVGIEYFSNQYNYCKKIFENKKNIKIVQADFFKSDFFQYDPDCFFLNRPIEDDLVFIETIKKLLNFPHKHKKILLIFVNCDNKILKSLINIQCIDSFYTNVNKGYSIYLLEKE